MLVYHLYTFFSELPIQDTFSNFIGLFGFVLSFKRSSYILDINSLLLDLCFTNIFLQAVACLFTSLMASIADKNTLLLIKSKFPSFHSLIVFLVLYLQKWLPNLSHLRVLLSSLVEIL